MRFLPYVAGLVAATVVGTVSAAPSLEPEAVLPARAFAAASRSIDVDAEQAFEPRSSAAAVHRRGGAASLAGLFGPTRNRRNFTPGGARIKNVGALSGHANRGARRSKKRSTTCKNKAAASTSKSSSSSKATSSAKATTTAKAAATSSAAAKATTTSSASGSKTTSASSSASTALAMGGYWPEWVASTLPPEKIDWTKYSYMAYAFAVPNSDGTVSLTDSTGAMLKRLVKAGHAGGSKILLSIGGWGQSNGFSPSAASDTMRAKFVKSVLSLYNTYNIDGIDIDWEYPNNAAAGTYSAQDTANFQSLLQALRAGLPSNAIITAAVAQAPWLASNGQSVVSVARAAGALDYIMIMNYDVWGSSSTPGPNAPLANLCGNSTQPGASAAAAVKQWAAAGMPKSKMIMGSPFYGYVSTSSKTTLVQRDLVEDLSDPNALLRSRHYAHRPLSTRSDATTAERRALTSGDGQVNFSALVSQGVLTLSGSEYIAGSGFTKYWDDCSDTPYIANGQKVVTYDDPDSLYDKGAFVQQAGLGGSAVWSVDGDVSSGALVKALRSGMGLS